MALLAPALREGDSVGLICPSSPLNSHEDMDFAVSVLRELGLNPVVGRHAFSELGYLAGEDRVRADDINEFFNDPNIRAIVSPRGGYGLLRTLPLLDYGSLERDPKIIMGFSDLTILVNAVAAKTGLVTFHGPTLVKRFFTASMFVEFRRILMTRRAETMYEFPAAHPICPGTATGRLYGGNLTTFSALLGTPYAPRSKPLVLLVEDLYELPRKLDKCIRQVAYSDLGQSAAGYIAGHFYECVTPPLERNIDWPVTLREFFVNERLPALMDVDVGHVPMQAQAIMPIGAEVTVHAADKVIVANGPLVSS